MKLNILKNKNKDIKRSEYAFKKTIYSSAFIAFAIVALILLNIFASVMYEKFPLEVDLTKDGVYTLSEENIEYIKTIEDEVTVYVWADQQSMTNGSLESFFQTNFYYYDETGKYFSQLKKNIEAYVKHNDKIKIEYVDVSSPEASDIKSKFPNEYIYAGDLLVTATVEVDGTPTEKLKHLNAYDLFTAEYDSSTYYYKITGSNLENQLGSAINYVTTKESVDVAFMSGIGDVSVLSALKSNLELNSYKVTEVSNFKDILNYDVVVIAAPTKDLTETELDLLDKFLDNDGKKGKVLSVFANPAAADTPNFDEFLDEWGIEIGDGTVAETNEDLYYPDNPYTFFYTPESTEYTSQIPSDMYLLSANNSPIYTTYETDGARTTTVLAYSNDTACVRPKNAPDSWSTKEKEQAAVPLAIACEETDGENGSVVLAFSSTDLASSDWLQYSAIADMDYLVNSIKYAYEQNTESVTFISRTISTDSIFDQVSQSSSDFMRVIFVYVIPILFIAIGIVVFVKRKNR